MNLTMSETASDTGMRLMAASRRSCSVTALCCCNVDTIISITAVSDSPMLEAKQTTSTRNEIGRSLFALGLSEIKRNELDLTLAEYFKLGSRGECTKMQITV